MKGRFFAVLVMCALLAWAVCPAWGEEQAQKITTHPLDTSEQQVQDQADTTSDTSTAQQPDQAAPAESAAPMEEKSDSETATQESPAAEQEAQEPAAESTIQIKDAVVCQDVVDRSPVGSGDVFSKDIEKIYCFARVAGMQGQGSITHNWYYKGTLKASVKLPVRSSNWRTWSSKTMTPEWAGEWMVEILSDQGTPLQSIIFFIQ